ncbi:hypothetical protein E2F43_00310 [Seongchinamella unica]|uniref:Cytochrome c oxidase subunit IV n=2 Tax=Seongchinamella TaxID=2919372 RepID=A0A4R5LTP3_9GAMM|nr:MULTISPECIES: cytochrome C oxidase subunit IV family protein [Seongchinamella]RLQ20491.1 hypothetical protein DWB85_17220 [Seongchinamella sediminis]TDG14720.1 hypothetical protein E2F43_00310 [Seongchinamella unica]
MTTERESAHPGPKLLMLNWGVLVTLTLVSMGAALGSAGNWQPLPWWSPLLVLASTLFKCRQIMWVYLNLRTASSAWRGLLASLALLCVGVIAAAFLFTPSALAA